MKLFAALLHLYPASFRNEYASEMRADFLHRRRAVSGFAPVLLFWLTTLLDTMGNAVATHWDLLNQDLRSATRKLRKAPGFAATVILLTSLGIGATTAAFTLADHVLLRPLPFPDSDRLVKLWENRPGYPQMELSPPNYEDWKQRRQSFESVGAFTATSVNLAGVGEPQRVDGTRVSASLLPMLGIPPLLGRPFDPLEDQDGGPSVVILSFGLWQSTFGGDPTILGRKVLLNNSPATVIGIMPASFQFPNREGKLWVPLQLSKAERSDRTNNGLQGLARLKPGVSLERAQAELQSIAAQLEREHPKENQHTGATVYRMSDEVSKRSRLMLAILLAAALCVLLIACSNLANLLLARALSREKELAVRASLGAGRERLVRQLVTESLVLALAGGAAGVLAAQAALPLLMRLVPLTLPIPEPSIDLRILAFAFALTILTGLIFGVLPALRVCGTAVASGLREGDRAGSGANKERLRSTLVAVEVGVSVVLLVAAGLLLRALGRVDSIDPGFRTEGVLTLRTALPMPKYEQTSRRHYFYEQVLNDVRALPGVTNAAYISFLPMTMRGGIWAVGIGKVEVDRNEDHAASLRFVTPGFFQTMGIPLLQGRDILPSDRLESQKIAVVSASFAEKFFPGRNPLGQRFQFALDERTIAGVAGNVRVRGLERNSEPQVYLPESQVKDGWLTFYAPRDMVVRGNGDVTRLLPSISTIVRAADPVLPVSDVRLMEEIVAADSSTRRVQVRVLGVFSAVAILLACIGIHGMLSFSVARRSREIGVRIALGAEPASILGLVMRRSLTLTAFGVAVGSLAGYATGQTLASLLADIRPEDPQTYGLAAAIALVTTIVGSAMPAIRALRVDPTVVIRTE